MTQSEPKYFGLFIWIHDNPITGNVLNLKNIQTPRKGLADYKVGEVVVAKCPQFGNVEGMIGKISDESGKKELDEILKPGSTKFLDLIKEVYLTEEQKDMDEMPEGTNSGTDDQVEEDEDEEIPRPARKKPVKRKKVEKEATAKKSKKSVNSEPNFSHIAEDFTMSELSAFTPTEVVRPVAVRENTSEMLGNSLRLVNENDGGPSYQVPDWHATSCSSNCPSLSRVKSLESETVMLKNQMAELYGRLAQAENSLHWAWNNINQNMAYNTTRQPEPKVTGGQNVTNVDSRSGDSGQVEIARNGVVESEDQSANNGQSVYNGMIRSQLEHSISGVDCYRKGSIKLFRLMFSDEECKGRSLTGGRSSKGQTRPALENTQKLDVLRDIVQKKWSFATPILVNTVLRDILKPSRQPKDVPTATATTKNATSTTVEN